MTAERTLLVVDDEQENLDALQDIFTADYIVHVAHDGQEGVDRAREVQPDLIILDIVMPRMSGLQACMQLRQEERTRHIPIIFLTSRTEPETETFGLDLGADDFVTKPFNREVLRARVKKRLGAPAAPESPAGETTQLGDYTVLWDRQEVACGEEERIPLTGKEAHLLRLFVENKGRVLTRNTILERVWAETYITDRTIDSHIKELRRKIPPMAKMLKTVYGTGYRLDL